MGEILPGRRPAGCVLFGRGARPERPPVEPRRASRERDRIRTSPEPRLHQGERLIFFTLDAMRGLAALSVAAYHYGDFLFGARLLPSSYLAVDFFFILSGFVIAHAYDRRLSQGMPLRRFLLVRLVRLYPLYALGSLIGLAYVAARLCLEPARPTSLSDLARAVVCAIFMIPEAGASSLPGLFPFDLSAWSLFFELAANLIYAATIRIWTPRRLAIAAILLGLALLEPVWARGSLDVGMVWPSFVGGALRCGFGFTLGVLLRRLWSRKWFNLPPVAGFVLLEFVLATPASEALRPWFDLACVFLVFPALIAVSTQTRAGRSRRLFETLATLSYPVYLLHTPLLFVFGGVYKVAAHKDPFFARPTSGFLFFGGSVVLSYIVATRVDLPLRRALRRLFGV